jgi:hypothetical protein
MDNTSPAAAVRSSGTPQPLDARQLSRQPRLPLLSADNELSVQCGRVLLVVLILAVWEFGAGRWFDIFFFSKPSLILAFLAKEVVDPQFYRDLGVTGMELGMGYSIGGVGGIVFGILLARWRFVGRLADPFLLAFNSIPRIAIAPMLIVWFGIGMASKVFLAATLVFFITFFNTLSGIRGVERGAGAGRQRVADLHQGHDAARLGLDHDRPEDEPAFRPGRRGAGRVPGGLRRPGLPPQQLRHFVQHHRCHRHDHRDDADHDGPDRRGRCGGPAPDGLAAVERRGLGGAEGLETHAWTWRAAARCGSFARVLHFS